MNRRFRRKILLGLLLASLLAVGGTWYYYRYLAAVPASAPAIKTARARRGDITITAAGAGSLLPAAQANLGFKSGGWLAELLVQTGDQVEAGEVLARLDDTDARLQVAQAEISLKLAELKLDELIKGADAASLAAAQENLRAAREELEALLAGLPLEEQKIAAADLEKAAIVVQKAQADYDQVAWQDDIGALPQAVALQQATLDYEKAKANYELKIAGPSEAQLAVAQSKVAQAQAQLDDLVAGASPEAVETARLQVEQAQISLQAAQTQMESTVLRAPFAGTVTAIKANVGELVGATPIISIADLQQPLVQVYLDESELDKLAVGHPVRVVFDALPDDVFTGRVVGLDPLVSVVDGVPVVSAWAELDGTEDDSDRRPILAGMNASVELIAAERRGVVLIPIEAMRELAPGQDAVFVVAPDGELLMRPVQVGLKDYVNAEIISGLEPGEVVSTGTVDTGQ